MQVCDPPLHCLACMDVVNISSIWKSTLHILYIDTSATVVASCLLIIVRTHVIGVGGMTPYTAMAICYESSSCERTCLLSAGLFTC